MEGFRTFLAAALMAALPTLSTWLLGIDWVSVLTGWGLPQGAVVPLAGLLGGAVMGLMRSITSTPPGVK